MPCLFGLLSTRKKCSRNAGLSSMDLDSPQHIIVFGRNNPGVNLARQGPLSASGVASPPTIIESLNILNYRSCIDTGFILQPDLSVLIGPNGTGKTTVLNAFLLLRSLAMERPFARDAEEVALTACRLRASFKFKSSSGPSSGHSCSCGPTRTITMCI